VIRNLFIFEIVKSVEFQCFVIEEGILLIALQMEYKTKHEFITIMYLFLVMFVYLNYAFGCANTINV